MVPIASPVAFAGLRHDGVFFKKDNRHGYSPAGPVRRRIDAAQGRDLGYTGKICVTPGQVKLSHQAFSPSAQERDYARRLVAAYAEATARGIGTIDFEGRMIDGPLLKRAQAIVAAPEV